MFYSEEAKARRRQCACAGFKTATDAVMREQRMLVFYAELQGGKAT